MFLSFFVFFFILGDGNFFDEKDIKTGDEEVTTARPPKSHRVSEKTKRQMMSKYVAFSLLFL